MIDEWSRDTETGDRAELEDLPEDSPFWTDISASAENCIGAECPRYDDCFVTRMRQRAAASDVVIVNHHLLCADAAVRQSAYGEVIPFCERAVIDEAHQLEDVATQYFGRAISNYRVDSLTRDLDRAAGSDLHAGPREGRRSAGRHRRASATTPACCSRRCRCFASRRRRHTGSDARIRIRPAHTARVADAGLALVGALEAVEADIALTRDASGGAAGDGAARRRAARRPQVPAARRRPGLRVFPRRPRPRRLPARVADRRLGHPARDAARSDEDAGADVGDADLGRVVRVRAQPAGHPRRRRDPARLGVRLRATGDPLPAAQDAGSAVAAVRPGRGARDRRDPEAHAGARVRAVHQLRQPARGARGRRSGARVPDPRAGHRAPVGAAARLQGHAATPCCSRRPASGRASTWSARR